MHRLPPYSVVRVLSQCCSACHVCVLKLRSDGVGSTSEQLWLAVEPLIHSYLLAFGTSDIDLISLGHKVIGTNAGSSCKLLIPSFNHNGVVCSVTEPICWSIYYRLRS